MNLQTSNDSIQGRVIPQMPLELQFQPPSKHAWIITTEDGHILAGCSSFSAIKLKYPSLQVVLKMWHKMWYRGSTQWVNFERNIAGQDDTPGLRLKAVPMMFAAPDGSGELSSQFCGMLINICISQSQENDMGKFGLSGAERRVAELIPQRASRRPRLRSRWGSASTPCAST